MHKRSSLVYTFILVLLLTSQIIAQQFEYVPGVKYDPAIPTLKQVVGHAWGENITTHHETEKYIHALEAASNKRLKVIRYGQTWEGRALYVIAIGSAANLERIDEIKAGMKKLSDPRKTSGQEAESLIASLPSSVWLMCSVHGNEISSTDAGLLTAYHLLAAKDDVVVDSALKNSIVLIDPIQNPDGRDRFINWFRQNLGLYPNEDMQAAEHNENWPSGRVNHYLFDMNRDWFAQTQPETQGRTKFFLEWFPQVVADLHEMGTNNSYYFAPPALPLNPNLTSTQLDWLNKFGKNNASWFDRFGFDYYTRENFDSFYPGYGEGWPLFQGSIGMTYEQASVRGLAAKRNDDTVLMYKDSVHHHFIASLSTIENTAKNREGLLRYFYEYRRSAVDEGLKETVKEYIIESGNDPSRAARLATMLQMSGIEVKRADNPFSNPSTRDYNKGELLPRTFPAGAYIISTAQPAKRLLKTLMDKHTEQDKVFIDEQRRRNKLRQPEEFYDVTAWSLPLLFDVPVYVAEIASKVNATVLLSPPRSTGELKGGAAKLAYLIPWGAQSAIEALSDMFQQSLRIHAGDKSFKLNGVSFNRGTLIVKVKDNPADLYERMKKLSTTYGIDIYSTDSSWVDDGPNFGSDNVNYIPRPRIALVYDIPTNPTSAGWTRYQLERRFKYPVTAIRAQQLKSADLSSYNVIILPDSGGYQQQLGDGAFLKDWVQQGGTVIGLAGAVNWLTDEKVALISSKREKKNDADKSSKTKSDDKKSTEPDKADAKPDLTAGLAPEDEYPNNTPGAIMRVNIDSTHWLGFGYGDSTTVMVDSNRIYSLLKLDKGTNVAIYSNNGDIPVSGFMWDDAKKLLPNKAYLMDVRLGSGHVIGFVEDPNYRGFMDGLSLMFMNAVFLSAGH